MPAKSPIEVTAEERAALDSVRPKVIAALNGYGCTQAWVAAVAGVRKRAAGELLRELGTTKGGANRWLLPSLDRKRHGERAWANPTDRSDQ